MSWMPPPLHAASRRSPAPVRVPTLRAVPSCSPGVQGVERKLCDRLIAPGRGRTHHRCMQLPVRDTATGRDAAKPGGRPYRMIETTTGLRELDHRTNDRVD